MSEPIKPKGAPKVTISCSTLRETLQVLKRADTTSQNGIVTWGTPEANSLGKQHDLVWAGSFPETLSRVREEGNAFLCKLGTVEAVHVCERMNSTLNLVS